MKIIIVLVLLSINVLGADQATFITKVADAIFWAEGGNINKPYGLINYKLKAKEDYRAKCIFHVTAYYNKWDKRGDFVDYLGQRWAPTKGVPAKVAKLNNNWSKNVKYFLRNPKKAV